MSSRGRKSRRQRGPGRPRVGDPGEETVATTVRLPASWVDSLDEHAQDGQSRADVVREILREWLESR